MHFFFYKNRGAQASEDFKWSELACPCCGVRFISPAAISKLQIVRDIIGPLTINSAARCPLHNARVHGAPLSEHRASSLKPSTAFDVSLIGHDKQKLISAAVRAGFKGIGINYRSFVHMDDRPIIARW